ncbi:MAG: hypothetical protein ACRDJN_22700 [Chloroflexota bacterium]
MAALSAQERRSPPATRPYSKVYRGANGRTVYEAAVELRCAYPLSGQATGRCGRTIAPGERFTRYETHLGALPELWDLRDPEATVAIPPGVSWQSGEAGIVRVPICSRCQPIPGPARSTSAGGRP